MLKRRTHPSRLVRARQQGMVLIVALVVLVALTVAGIAMIRSVDTATLVAGNLAFQQAANHASDKGIEQAMAMLKQKSTEGSLDTNDPSNGYSAQMRPLTDNPAINQSWQEFWQASLAASAYDAGEDQFKNHIYFVVHRLCANAAPPGANGQCVESPAITSSSSAGNGMGAGDLQINAASQVYYRITVRVAGPKRTESYVQSHVAL
jgi:type IV pilus assembly protein PilX